GVAAVGSDVYVLGGIDKQVMVVADVLVYRTEARRWDRVAPMPRALHHLNVAAQGGRIYVVGALVDFDFLPTGAVYAYDPIADRWETRTAMPAGTERGASGTTVLDGAI